MNKKVICTAIAVTMLLSTSASPSKTNIIIADSDGDINKIVGY